MPIEYVLSTISGGHRDVEPTKVQTTRITKLEKLQKNQIGSLEQCWNKLMEQILWSQPKNTKNKFQFGDYVLWFPKGENTHLGKFKKRWFGPFRV
jgi:hypothetical protein